MLQVGLEPTKHIAKARRVNQPHNVYTVRTAASDYDGVIVDTFIFNPPPLPIATPCRNMHFACPRVPVTYLAARCSRVYTVSSCFGITMVVHVGSL